MTAKHTPVLIAVLVDGLDAAIDGRGYGIEHERARRRIRASLVACEGIPTEALESGVVTELLAALEKCEWTLVEAQRLASEMGGEDCAEALFFDVPLAQARAAIAKAQKGD